MIIERMEIDPRILLFKYKQHHKDKKCFIMGSGPSILDMDITKFTDHITIVCNNFNKGLWIKKINFIPTVTIFISGKSFDINLVKSPIIMATPNIKIENFNQKKTQKRLFFIS